jgi:hypothetical protein
MSRLATDIAGEYNGWVAGGAIAITPQNLLESFPGKTGERGNEAI